MCSDLLSHYKADGESFLSEIITGDKMQTTTLNCRQEVSGMASVTLRANFIITNLLFFFCFCFVILIFVCKCYTVFL